MATHMRRAAGLGCTLLAVVVLAAACSDTASSQSPETTLVLASTSTTLVAETPSITGDVISGSTSSTVVEPIVVVGLPVSVVFPTLDRIDPTLSLRPLAPGDLDRLNARFRQDERVDSFLEDVDARGVYQDEDLVAVAVAVAVTPGAASTSGFAQSFLSGATDGGVTNPVTVDLLDQVLTPWATSGDGGNTHHLLWSYENLFLIVSGRDSLLVRDISEAIVTMVLAPPPPTTTTTAPEICVEPGEGEADEADPDVDEDPDAEPVVCEHDESGETTGESTTTTSG